MKTKTQEQLDKQILNRWNKMKKFSGLRDKVDGLIEAARREAIRECVDYIQHTKLWSKGTVEGTRNDIIAKLQLAKLTKNE